MDSLIHDTIEAVFIICKNIEEEFKEIVCIAKICKKYDVMVD